MINKFSEDYVSGFSHGYVRAETIGRKITKDACSQLGTAVLDNLLDVMDGYAAKGYDEIPVDDVKMEVCLCIGSGSRSLLDRLLIRQRNRIRLNLRSMKADALYKGLAAKTEYK